MGENCPKVGYKTPPFVFRIFAQKKLHIRGQIHPLPVQTDRNDDPKKISPKRVVNCVFATTRFGMDQKSLKIDKKGLNMDCRYKGHYVVLCSIFVHILFFKKVVGWWRCVCIDRPEYRPYFIFCSRQSSICTKMQQDRAKGSRLVRDHFQWLDFAFFHSNWPLPLPLQPFLPFIYLLRHCESCFVNL